MGLEVDIVVTLDGSSPREDYLKSFRSCIRNMWQIHEARCTKQSVQFRHGSSKVDVDLVFTYDTDAHSAFEVFQQRRSFQPRHGGKRSRYATDFDLFRDSSANVSKEQVQLIA